MVEYSTWVGIVFDVAKSKGFDPSFESNQEVTQAAAELWNQHRADLKQATAQEAADWAIDEIEIA